MDVFATFQSAMATLAAAAGGEAGLMQVLTAGGGITTSQAHLSELQPLVSCLLRGTLAAHMAAQKAAKEQQRQAAAAALDEPDWGSAGEEAMM